MSEIESLFEGPLRAALRHGLDFLEASGEVSVGATAGLASLRERLAVPLRDGGVDATRVIEELVRGVEGGILGSAGPRFFAWVIGGAVPAALAADWLTAVWDQNAALYASGPAAAVVEEVAGEWLKELLGIPTGASFALVTGCQMAHVTCLAAARHALLARRGWDVEEDGLAGAPAIRILTSTERHGTTVRAVRLLGMGTRRIAGLAVDEFGRLRADALAEELEKEPDASTIVVLQAGDLNLGAYDNFEELIPIARRFGAWVHVDGAFGLWAAASPRFRYLMAGAERADSWTTDGHKWLNVPYDSGYAFVADREAHRASMSHRAAYLTHDAEARDEMDWNPEWSRRGRGFATYAALREMGRNGVAGLIERTCDCARELVLRVGALEGAEVVWEPTINQGLVRYVPFAGASEEECDRFTDRVMAEVVESGEAMFTGTTWRGRRAMRVSVCNWRTTGEDVERVVRCVEEVLRRMAGHIGVGERQPQVGR